MTKIPPCILEILCSKYFRSQRFWPLASKSQVQIIKANSQWLWSRRFYFYITRMTHIRLQWCLWPTKSNQYIQQSKSTFFGKLEEITYSRECPKWTYIRMLTALAVGGVKAGKRKRHRTIGHDNTVHRILMSSVAANKTIDYWNNDL